MEFIRLKVTLPIQELHKVVEDNLAIVLIQGYGKLSQQEQIVGIVVHDCQVIDHYCEKLGDPVDFLKTEDKQNGIPPPTIRKQKLRSHMRKPQSEDSQEPEIHVRSPRNSLPIQKVEHRSSIGTIQIQQLPADCQKVVDLYPDLQNWEIVAKLIKKTYRQFISKQGKGKLTKVMNIELMDSTGMRITGAMFGDSAQDFYKDLEEDMVYKVSKGQIREDQFNQNKSKHFSRYTIMLTRNSEFRKVPNSNTMAEYKTQLTTINQIYTDPHISEEYDSVGILAQVHEEVQIPKQSKTLYKQALMLVDPEHNKMIECIIWNRNNIIPPAYLNKVIALYGFRLNQYNQTLSLNSSYHSDVRVLENHPYCQFEGKIQRDKIQMMSERKEKGNVEIEEAVKNLKELEDQLVYLEQGKEIKSTMCLMLTFISNKKWSYESCPHCRRSAQAYNKCNNCERYIDETIPRYKLNVELSDSCGSIWATGFEQFGGKLFMDISEGIKHIKTLDESQRQRLFEKKQFQEFLVRLTSKFDRDGSVKHTINRVYEINIGKKSIENVQRIKGYL